MTEDSYFVEFYRDASGSDCTNGGVSSRFKTAVLYRPECLDAAQADGFGNQAGVPRLRLVERVIGGKPYLHAQPVGETRHVMFGGNFIWSCDSRFRREVSQYPIPVHDRVE